MMQLGTQTALAAGLVTLLAAGSTPADADPVCRTTDDPHVLRDDLVPAPESPEPELLLRFVQLSDAHILDDDGHFLNGLSLLNATVSAARGAQRMQDEYTDEVLNSMVQTVNACHADPSVGGIEFVIVTGDLIDLGVTAELRRFIDNMDGTFDRVSAFEKACANTVSAALPEEVRAAVIQERCTRFTGRGVADTQTVDPDPDDPIYQSPHTRAVQQALDTETAVVTGRDEDGNTDPARQTLTRSPGLPPSLRCEAGEDGCANSALARPYYVALGNHDAYPRGTVVYHPGFNEASFIAGRRFMTDPREIVAEFFETSEVPGPVGHGFNHVDELRARDADPRNETYYALDAPGTSGRVRMIVLNTMYDGVDGGLTVTEADSFGAQHIRNPFGLEAGAITPDQFEWLQGELAQAAATEQVVLVFSHHPDRSFNEFGELGFLVPGTIPVADLNAELARHPNVIAWISGHTHRNVVRAFVVDEDEEGNLVGSNGTVTAPIDCPAGKTCPGFWQVETSSLIDFPQEARLIEVFDNGDGTGTLRATLLEHGFERSRALAEADDRCQFYLTDPAAVETFITEGDLTNLCFTDLGREGEPDGRNVELVFAMPGA